MWDHEIDGKRSGCVLCDLDGDVDVLLYKKSENSSTVYVGFSAENVSCERQELGGRFWRLARQLSNR